jgi:3-oxoadipate CoA-transferase alpha subunit
MAFRPIYESAAEAVADVFDGARIMLGGFSAALGAPHDLFRAVLESTQARDLTWIGNGTPQIATVNENGERQTVTFPIERVKKCICSFPVSPSLRRGFGSPFEAAFGDGTVDLELVPQGTLAERLRAGGAGIPAFFTPTGVGTPFANGKEVRDFDGRSYVLERWLRADFALVRAIRADRLGNLIYRNTARNFNPPMAMAANVTIAEVDEIVEPGELRPEEIVTPGIFVNRLYLRSRNNDRG